MHWGMQTPACDGEVFNLTNGDVFSWRDVWPSVVEATGVALGDPEPTRLTEWIPARAEIWDAVVREHGLRPHGLTELLGESVGFASALLGVGETELRPPALVSTVKVRRFGFHECVDSEDSIVAWLRRLQQMRILPPG